MDSPETRTSSSKAGTLKQRLQTAGLLIIVFVLFFLFTPVWLMWLVATLVVLAASWEYFEMTDRDQSRGDRILCLVLAALFPLAAWAGRRECLYGTLFISLLVLSFRAVLSREDLRVRFENLHRRMYGILLVGFSLSHFLLLAEINDFRRWIFAILIVIYMGDGAAYLVGSYMGRRRLAARLSPKKTWEGAAGGLAGSIASMYLFKWLFLPAVSGMEALVLAVVVGLSGQMGDLAESLIKRSYDVKDSGHLLPGHGGILDRIDSVMFAVPTAYYLILFLHA